jgi:tetratricopeptide (TPR) repeat protein
MYDKALTLANQLTRNDPTSAVWWKGLTHIYLQLGQYREALAAMTIYSYLAPMSDTEYRLLADLFLQQGIPRKAIENYDACTFGKKDKQAALRLVQAYRSIDRLSLALEKLDGFAEILDAEAYEIERAEILYSMKRYEEAADSYLKVAEREGKDSDRASLMAGYSFWQLQENEKAIAAFSAIAAEKKYAGEAAKAISQLTNKAHPDPGSTKE